MNGPERNPVTGRYLPRSGERPICSVDGCDKPMLARGWCAGHYQRWRTSGDIQSAIPLVMGRPNREPIFDRLARRTVQVGECWIYCASPTGGGYVPISVNGQRESTHRLSYTTFVGPIPEGHEIDHVKARGCISRACWNPAHLEPVLGVENLARGESDAAYVLRTGFCKRGHEFTGSNIRVSARRTKTGEKIAQQCRICEQLWRGRADVKARAREQKRTYFARPEVKERRRVYLSEHSQRKRGAA